MNRTRRIVVALAALLVLAGGVLSMESLRRTRSVARTEAGEPTLVPGGIPIYWDGRMAAGFVPQDLEQLQQVSFVDAEEGKAQEGWLLRDVLQLHLGGRTLSKGMRITVISSSREREADLLWSEVEDPENWVMFDVSGRGTLKLVSVLERLDTRDEWVQDVDRIEVQSS
jgi:hypothetical protein